MVIKTEIVEDEGKIHVNRTQDIEPVLHRNHALHTSDLPKHSGSARWRYVGEIPLVLVEKWAKETGLRVGSAEFLEYCKKKLKDPDFKKLIIRGL